MPANGEDPIAGELRKFFAGQIIFTILEDVRDEQRTYPPVVKAIFREAADGLFEFGRDQAVALAHLADELVDWMQRRQFVRVGAVAVLGRALPSLARPPFHHGS